MLKRLALRCTAVQMAASGRFGVSHHLGHDIRVKACCRPTVPRSFVSSCGLNPLFNYRGTVKEEAVFVNANGAYILGSFIGAEERGCIFQVNGHRVCFLTSAM